MIDTSSMLEHFLWNLAFALDGINFVKASQIQKTPLIVIKQIDLIKMRRLQLEIGKQEVQLRKINKVESNKFKQFNQCIKQPKA